MAKKDDPMMKQHEEKEQKTQEETQQQDVSLVYSVDQTSEINIFYENMFYTLKFPTNATLVQLNNFVMSLQHVIKDIVTKRNDAIQASIEPESHSFDDVEGGDEDEEPELD